MCVICIKSAGVALPEIETFERCFTANPDGAGFAYPIRDTDDDTKFTRIQVRKGLKTFGEFRAQYEQLLVDLGSNMLRTPVLLHFRIGTHGSKAAPGQTHPFPVCSDYKIMEQLEGQYQSIMMHNGIYNLGKLAGNFSRYVTGDNPSDSEEFAANVLEPMLRMPAWDADDKVLQLIAHLNGLSKLVIMSIRDDGSLILRSFGEFVTNTDGMIYSNRSFEPVKEIEPWPKYSYDNCSKDTNYRIPVDSKEKLIPRSLTSFRNLRISMESWLESELGSQSGGYSRVYREGMLTWYFPVVVTTRKAHGPLVANTIDDPCDPWYTDATQSYLYHLDTEKNVLLYVGKIETATRITETTVKDKGKKTQFGKIDQTRDWD